MSLRELFDTLRALVAQQRPGLQVPDPVHEDFRPGDVRHAQADIGRARRLLGYAPTQDARAARRQTLAWYDARAGSNRAAL